MTVQSNPCLPVSGTPSRKGAFCNHHHSILISQTGFVGHGQRIHVFCLDDDNNTVIRMEPPRPNYKNCIRGFPHQIDGILETAKPHIGP